VRAMAESLGVLKWFAPGVARRLSVELAPGFGAPLLSPTG
jgi:hypothetical protein